MAVEYFDLQTIQRSAGQSAVAKASYNAGDLLHDKRINKSFDYGSKQGIVYSEIIFPQGVAKLSREDLWNQVEASETRINSQVARSLEIALPLELNAQKRIALALAISKELSIRYDCPIDCSVHEPIKRKPGATAKENPHGHMMIPDRDRSGKKIRSLSTGKKKDSSGKTEIDHLRALIEKTVRSHLDENGLNFVSYSLEKKPPLLERIAAYERNVEKNSRQIRAIENAIRRLENNLARGDRERIQENSSAGISTIQNVPAFSSTAKNRHSYKTDRTNTNNNNGFTVERNAAAARSDSRPGERDNGLDTRIDNRGSGAKHSDARNNSTTRSPGTKCTSLTDALSLLKHKLEQLQQQATMEAINGQGIRKATQEKSRLDTEKTSTGSRASQAKIENR